MGSHAETILIAFEAANELTREGREDEALDILWDTLDEMLCADQMTEINEALSNIDISKLDPLVVLGILTVTFVASPLLPAYSSCYRDAYASFLERGMSLGRVRALLDGKEPEEDVSR